MTVYQDNVKTTLLIDKFQERFDSSQQGCPSAGLQNKSISGDKHAALTASHKKTIRHYNASKSDRLSYLTTISDAHKNLTLNCHLTNRISCCNYILYNKQPCAMTISSRKPERNVRGGEYLGFFQGISSWENVWWEMSW